MTLFRKINRPNFGRAVLGSQKHEQKVQSPHVPALSVSLLSWSHLTLVRYIAAVEEPPVIHCD